MLFIYLRHVGLRVELNLAKHETSLCEEVSLQHYGILLKEKALNIDRKSYL